MRYFATLCLALALVGCGDRNSWPLTGPATAGPVQPTPAADPIAKVCDDYATALEVVTPLKATIPPKVVSIIDKANAIGSLACIFGPAGSQYSAAVAAWAAKGGAA